MHTHRHVHIYVYKDIYIYMHIHKQEHYKQIHKTDTTIQLTSLRKQVIENEAYKVSSQRIPTSPEN